MTKTELMPIVGTENENRIADIVFVHGLDGDKEATWKGEWEEELWPKTLYNDLPLCGYWSFGYDSKSSLWLGSPMTILDRANNFTSFLRSEGIGKRPVFFVVHSLGGLVVKKMLRFAFDQDQDDSIVGNTKGIFFFATPHTGSKVPSMVQWFKPYRPSGLLEELKTAAEPLLDLNNWYRANSTKLGIDTVVFRETDKTGGVLVVDEISSDPGITGVMPIPIDANHIEICKLNSSDLAYKTIRNSMEEFIRNEANRQPIVEEGIWMDVSCFNKFPDQWEEGRYPKSSSRTLTYEVSRSESGVEVAPKLNYLEAIRNAEPVWALDFMWQPFRWLPLNLDLKFLNNSKEPVYITQIRFDVESSRLNNEPVFCLKRGSSFPYINIDNDGWCEVSNPKLRLGFADGGGEPSFPDKLDFEMELPDFDDGTAVDLTEQFEQLGVDVEGVIKRKEGASLGPFQSGIAYVYGALEYDAPDGRRREFKFGTDIRVEGPLFGMFGPPSFEYQAKLKVDGKNYQVPVEVSHIIQPGESDRVLVQLDVEKSSFHRIRITAIGNKGQFVTSDAVDVEMFIPRSVSARIHESENLFSPESN